MSFYHLLISLILIQSLTAQKINYQGYFQSGSSYLGSVATCYNGSLQSPLSVSNTTSYFTSSINFVSEKYQQTQATGKSLNSTTNYISVTPQGGNFGSVIFNRLGYLSLWYLNEIRVRSPSEHQINNVSSSLEIQFIHSRDYTQVFDPTQNTPLTDANMFLGISVIFTNNITLATKNDISMTNLANDVVSGATNNQVFSFNMPSYSLISKQRRFYVYEGSDTVPPNCNENYNWVIMADTYFANQNTMNIVNNLYQNYFTNGNNKPFAVAYSNTNPVYRNFQMNSTDNAVYRPPIVTGSSGFFKANILALLISMVLYYI